MTATPAKVALAALSAIVLLVGCSKGAEALGEVGDPGDVSQVIEISASDELRFDPSEIDVAAGETVEFKVTNDGRSPHEFVLGPAHEHEEGMQHGPDNATGEIAPGDTASVIWSFPESGETEFACHIADHDKSGMTGTVTVSE
jgi:uncharacterized cupredoxin-like copper-binding protein